MREILFRGKRVDNEQWIYGYYIKATHHWHEKGIHEDWIVCRASQNGGWFTIQNRYAVIPETVGQYTGLTDRNGKKIFEGDIVVVYARGYHTVCTVSWAETVAHFQLWQVNTIPNTPTALNLGNYDCEIIGNIHDKPELLKGDKE